MDITDSKWHKNPLGNHTEQLNLLTKIADLAPAAVHKFRREPDGSMSMPYATPAIVDIYGMGPADLARDFSPAWALIHPDDRETVHAAMEQSARTLERFHSEWRVRHPTKGEIWVECLSTPEPEPDGGIVWYGYFHDITERKRAEAERLAHLRFFESMDRVNRAIQETSDLEQMMSDVLEVLLSIFDCDRAWLVYPCDPEAASWRVPMERTRPEYPGGLALGIEFPMHPDIATAARLLLDSHGPVQFGAESEHPVPADVAKDYHVRSFIAMALHPKTGKPWMFGLHQCTYPRTWSPDEVKLFREIGRRLSDALTSLLTHRDLRESERKLGEAQRTAHVGYWERDLHTDRINWSDETYRIFGLRPQEYEMNGSRLRDLLHPEDREKVPQAIAQAIAGHARYDLEYRLIRPNGELRLVHSRGDVKRDETGTPRHMFGILQDITERRKSEEHLALLSFALNHVQEAAFLIDERSRFLYVNDEACRSLGHKRDELLRMGVVDINPGYPMEHWVEHWSEIREQGSVTLETTHRRKDGRIFPVEVSANYFTYDGRGYNLALVRDITLRKEQESRIQYLAYYDALTDLPNRTLTMDRLDRALAQAQRHRHTLAVLFVDLDRFKTINDTLGHPAGDTLLQQAGARLTGMLRKQDTIGRMGGDEFLILLPELTSAEDAAHISEKILASLSIPFQVAGQELHVTTSIGISLYPRDADDAATLVKYADTALYLAKEQGRDTFRFFGPALNAKIQEQLHMERELRCAIERNELLLHYQPQLELATGTTTGMEALLRWRHPVTGLIPPDRFIPVAEDIGLIIPIGEWVLRTASLQARSWQAAGMPNVRVGINVSQRQLDQTDFAAMVCRILKETGCDPQLLELEITESSVMQQPEQSIAKLQALHEMGIQLALDDFGTGYSSLAYLKRFPLDRLKIDRSFVSGIPEDGDDMAIVQAIIALARQLRLKVVAEGVETEAQRQFLKQNGCEEIQGYLLSEPLPARELEQLFGFPAHAPP